MPLCLLLLRAFARCYADMLTLPCHITPLMMLIDVSIFSAPDMPFYSTPRHAMLLLAAAFATLADDVFFDAATLLR